MIPAAIVTAILAGVAIFCDEGSEAGVLIGKTSCFDESVFVRNLN